MSDDQRYTPISCEIYSRLELHIMHCDVLRMQWREDENIIHVEAIWPYDLKTVKDSGEFLIARDSKGNGLKIRLDRIIGFEPVVNETWGS
jgi:Rho-binding antiterminator